jgi:hypothetical protein
MVRPTWDPKINLGNLLTILAMLGGAVALWGKMESRAATLEVRQNQIEKREDRFEDDIVRRLERIENKLDRR